MKAIFITVRTGSTRLKNKALLQICEKPTIVFLIERLKRSQKADAIILCTTELEEDNVLADIAQQNGILCYRGSVKDKLDRWYQAAQQYNVDFFVTADGDDLFCEPELIDLAFMQYDKFTPDFIEGKGLICGSFTYAIKSSALQTVCEMKDTEDTEMMWVYFTETGLFDTACLEGVPDVFKKPELRMTLDYEEDFVFFKTVIEHFSDENMQFTMRDIVAFLDKNPDVIKINQLCQNKYLQNQKSKIKLVLRGCGENIVDK